MPISLRLAAVVAGLAALAAAAPAGAATLLSADHRPAAEALGAAQDDTVWFSGSANGNIFHASGTLIRGADYDWVLTAAHVIRFPSGTISIENMAVGDGTSYQTDRGTTSGIGLMYLSESYVPGSDAGDDYAFLRLTSRLTDENYAFKLASGPPNLGDALLFSGFGIPRTRDGAALPNTGNVMAFYGAYDPVQPSGWNPRDEVGFASEQYNLATASPGDSGGTVKSYNSLTEQWEYAGILLGGNNAATIYYPHLNGDPRFTSFLLNEVRPVEMVPEPGMLGLLGAGALLVGGRGGNGALEVDGYAPGNEKAQ